MSRLPFEGLRPFVFGSLSTGKSKRRLCDHSMILAQYKSKKDFEHTARSTALEIRKKRQSEDSSGFIAP